MNTWQKLKWLILSGITESVAESPIQRTQHTHASTSSPLPNTSSFSEEATLIAHQALTLSDLYARRATFDDCPLKKTAAHTLNGFGAENPTVLCLLEAPDTADEKEGQLLSGPAGDLFQKMLQAIGLNLTQNTYVSTLIPWRPPGNRQPTESELAMCRPFWEREITLLHPQKILLFGAGVSAALLGINSLSKARGHWHTYQNIPTLVTIPPATLLKLPAQKKQAWDDLQLFQSGPS